MIEVFAELFVQLETKFLITQEKNTLQSVLSEKLYLKKGGELIIIISSSIMKKIL